jgi:hypothetical protein
MFFEEVREITESLSLAYLGISNPNLNFLKELTIETQCVIVEQSNRIFRQSGARKCVQILSFNLPEMRFVF